MNTFFTSDHHFWHRKILEYCPNRPYVDIEEMNEDYKYKWNSKIGVNDIVYHLGDFAFNIPWRIRDFLSQLNGKKILIKGNHDKYSKKSAIEVIGWTEVYGQFQFQEFMLSHRPNYSYKAKHLCGHVHQHWKFNDQGNILNVGVDIWNGYPLELEEIRQIYEQR